MAPLYLGEGIRTLCSVSHAIETISYLCLAWPLTIPIVSLVSNKYIWLRFVPTKNVVGVSLSQQHAHTSDPHWYRWISAQELMLVILAVLSCDTESIWSCITGLKAKSRIGSRWSEIYFSVTYKIYPCQIIGPIF